MINIVYITTNLINNKQYVGSHIIKNTNSDNYLGSGIKLKKSIKKYGKNKFKREIIKECVTIQEARILEEFYIKKYKTLYPIGYNISPTGGCIKTGMHSDETKKKIKIGVTGKKNGMYGKIAANANIHRSDKTKKRISIGTKLKMREPQNWKLFLEKNTMDDDCKNKISNTLKEKYKNNYKNPMNGKNHSIKTKKLMTLKAIGRKHSPETKAKMKIARQKYLKSLKC